MARYKKASEIKVGAIGYGGAFNIGRTHLTEMKLAGMQPVAVCEKDPARRKIAEEEFPGIKTYASLTTMLKKSDVDLIAVITPHNTHAKLALQCLKAGRHVVCEKPLAITTAECDAMIREAKKQKLMLSTYHNRHWDGCAIEAVKQICKKKVIGDIYRVEAHMGGRSQPRDWWRSSKSISGGILYDWGVHLLEYALQVIGDDIMEVSAVGKTGYWAPKTRWKKDTSEDEMQALVRFKSGVWLTLNMTSLDSNPKQGQIEFTGTEGSYIMDGGTYEVIKKQGNKKTVISGRNCKSEWKAYYQNIADHLVKGKKLVISPEWARRPIHILDLATQSMKQGRALKAKYT